MKEKRKECGEKWIYTGKKSNTHVAVILEEKEDRRDILKYWQGFFKPRKYQISDSSNSTILKR